MPHAELRVVGGPGEGRSVAVSTEIEIGRGVPDSPLLGDPSISRRHARVTIDSSGHLSITDLGSSNGTRVNGHVITAPTALAAGDVVDLGGTTLQVVEIGTEPVQPVAPTRQVQPTVARRVEPPEPPPRPAAAVRSRSIAAGLPVIPVKSIIASVRIRALIAAVAVAVALWVAVYFQEKSVASAVTGGTTTTTPSGTGHTHTAPSRTTTTTSSVSSKSS